jgi:hypothetical protein
MVELLLLLLLQLLLLLELSRLKLSAMALILLLLWSTQLTPTWGIHHAVHRRSTARTTTSSGSRCHPLPLSWQAREMHQALLQVDGEPCTIQVGLLFIRVDVVCAIFSQGVELPCVVKHTVVPLLKV